MEHANDNRVLESQGIASINLSLRWSDGRAEHEDQMHVEHFSVWREADLLPPGIGQRIVGMRAGDAARADLPAGELTGCWDATRQLAGSPSGFDRTYRQGLDVEPRYGRFYPQGFFNGFGEIVREAVEPARITALDEHSMRVDLNHPFARFSCDVNLQLDQVLSGVDMRGGRCTSPLDDLVRYPGLAAPVQGGMDTDYGDDMRGMSRMDERDDAGFYTSPRMVQHMDSRALSTVNHLYRRVLPKNAEVLDLMASCDSHLQGCSLSNLQVLGMNAAELQSNSAATARVVQDLNQHPGLPGGDASLDAIVCTASVEYLVNPQKVFLEVLRVLRPGGIFVLAFSNRWFPTKAIQIWSELQEFERVGMITQWLQHAGFENLRTFSSRGWPRPANDPHAREAPMSDPVYAVWGSKPST
jgi:SAM-dependent methyltransferase